MLAGSIFGFRPKVGDSQRGIGEGFGDRLKRPGIERSGIWCAGRVGQYYDAKPGQATPGEIG